MGKIHLNLKHIRKLNLIITLHDKRIMIIEDHFDVSNKT